MARGRARHDGRTLVSIMPFADMADRDLQAVISYLRTTAPVTAPAAVREATRPCRGAPTPA
jgi:hypothetical protein